MSITQGTLAFSAVFVATSLICTAECHEAVTRVMNPTSIKPVLSKGHAKILESV